MRTADSDEDERHRDEDGNAVASSSTESPTSDQSDVGEATEDVDWAQTVTRTAVPTPTIDHPHINAWAAVTLQNGDRPAPDTLHLR